MTVTEYSQHFSNRRHYWLRRVAMQESKNWLICCISQKTSALLVLSTHCHLIQLIELYLQPMYVRKAAKLLTALYTMYRKRYANSYARHVPMGHQYGVLMAL